MKSSRYIAFLVLALVSGNAWSQETGARTSEPKTIAAALQGTWSMLEGDFVSAAEVMPAEKYSFVPTNGEFKGVRTFAQQVKHVACANFAFFKEIEGETPPPDCLNGGPDPARTKAELMKYLRSSFVYADQVIAKINAGNALDPVSGPYGGPRTRLGMAVLAVWHASDHYGQIVEYLRMNGIVPPASRQAPQPRSP